MWTLLVLIESVLPIDVGGACSRGTAVLPTKVGGACIGADKVTGVGWPRRK